MKGVKRIFGAACVILCGMLLVACRAIQLEERSFPMLVAVSATEDGEAEFSYVFANEWSDVNAYLDYNHLKVVLFEESLLADAALYEAFLKELAREDTFPRNAYAGVTADMDELARAGEELAVDIGTYMENMLKTEEAAECSHLPTVGDLLDDKENRMRIWKLPVFSEKDGQIEITSYYKMEYGSPSALPQS